MNLGDQLEKKLKFFKIPNLIFIIISVSAFVFVFDHISFLQTKEFFLRNLLEFRKDLILKGQFWRVLTFVFIPFSTHRVFFAAIEGYFLYFLGTSLEVSVGERRFSLFYIFGVIFSILVGFITGYTHIKFLNMTLFFAFATINPNMSMLLFFIIPVKTFWLAIIDAGYFIYNLILSLIFKDYSSFLNAIFAIINFLIFFGPRFFMDIFYQFKNFQQKTKRMYKNGNYWGS